MIHLKAIIHILIFQAVFPSIVQARQCYLTNGKEADSTFQPCFPDQDDSPCCSLAKSNTTPNDICLSGGVCYIQDPNFRGLLRQGACTDKTWKSGQCPELCNTGKLILSFVSLNDKHPQRHTYRSSPPHQSTLTNYLNSLRRNPLRNPLPRPRPRLLVLQCKRHKLLRRRRAPRHGPDDQRVRNITHIRGLIFIRLI